MAENAALREARVMSLKTWFGNLKNVLDENSSQTEILVLESPFVATSEFDVMVQRFGDQVAFIDCTFPVAPGHDDLRVALERIRAEAEDAVSSTRGIQRKAAPLTGLRGVPPCRPPAGRSTSSSPGDGAPAARTTRVLASTPQSVPPVRAWMSIGVIKRPARSVSGKIVAVS